MRTTIFVPASRRRVRGGRSRGETEHVDRALEQAVATGADLDDVEAILEDGLNRLDELRTLRGDA